MAATATATTTAWKALSILPQELRLATTLKCGQSFRWTSAQDENDHTVWACALKGRLVRLRQSPSAIHYQSIYPHPSQDDTAELLHSYLNLNVDLGALYEQWSRADPNFKSKSLRFAGIRILNQDPFENLLSFICSSNNNIVRIAQMVEKLCITYGSLIATLDGRKYYDFPSLEQLVPHLDPNSPKCIDPTLRQLGFGYRARYIHQTIAILQQNTLPWLYSLRSLSYLEAKEQLLTLSGVGPKVADCVLLMSCNQPGSLPVDTHVWQIAQKHYGFARGKVLNAVVYNQVGDRFRQIFGEYAGWAHSVLFTADLRAFKDETGDHSVNLEASSLPFKSTKRRTTSNSNKSLDTLPKKPKLDPDTPATINLQHHIKVKIEAS